MHLCRIRGLCCARYSKFLVVYDPLQHVFWAAFAGSRAFALSNRNWIMLLLVCGLSLVPVVVNLIPEHYGITGENIPLAGCVDDDFTPPDVVVIASRASIIAAGSLLILVTWFSLFGKGAFRLMFGTVTFAGVLLRDGTIYFVILVVLNALHLAFSLASFAVPALQNVSEITAFTEPITAILVQRFLFHLQSANRRALDLDSSQVGGARAVTQQSSSLVFDRVIGSLGASIPPEDFLGMSEEDMVEDEQEGGIGNTSEET
ncbi:hypothetical protein LXA43DRAFT_741455 [Ganoderma leucocontextum]|nr:hypothetical protein LXA43DRAFT_741455 [Ganoderma leucocontextum]